MVRLAKRLGVGLPNALSISLELLLPGTDPGCIVFFCNLDALVAEQDRYALKWNTPQEEIHCKGVAKTVRVPLVSTS